MYSVGDVYKSAGRGTKSVLEICLGTGYKKGSTVWDKVFASIELNKKESILYLKQLIDGYNSVDQYW